MTFKSQSKLVILLVSLASLTLIAFNFYSSKIKSGIRAYINGESSYSKGHKDALLNLTSYLDTQDPTYWHRYNEALIVPQSDNKAKNAMLRGEPDSVAFNYLLKGRVHPEDIPNIIWMFKNFNKVPAFKEAVDAWTESETVLLELTQFATVLKQDMDKGPMDEQSKKKFFVTIANLNIKLTALEINFSTILSNLGRKVEKLLNYVNIFVTCLIVGSLSAYLMLIIAKLHKSRNELKNSYDKVFDLNLELDTFVYSLSHDLRAPLTSLQGLVKVAATENEVAAIKQYIVLMDTLLDKQDLFIRDVIALLQRRNLTPQPSAVDLKLLIEDAFSFNSHIKGNEKIRTVLALNKEVEEVYSDVVFIKIIVNNLISNAFKYSDPNKADNYVKVNCSYSEHDLIFEIEDNGIGIPKEFQAKIFEMFYVLDSRKGGTGLGLYIIKQSVEKLNGTIQLTSTLGEGTKFVISLPKFENELNQLV